MRSVLAISLSFSSFSSVAFACSCVPSGGCPGLGGQTGPRFLGIVLNVTDRPGADPTVFLSSRRARVRVDEPFGGLAADVREVDVYTGSGGGDCGIAFKVGEVYLIDAFVGQDGVAHAGICSSTRRMDDAGVLLRVLRQQRDGKPVPSLIGQVARQDRNFDGPLGTLDPVPLASLLVRVVEAELTCRYADERSVGPGAKLKSNKIHLAPGDDQEDLLLTMPTASCPEVNGKRLLTDK
jgi:hypothetical protein